MLLLRIARGESLGITFGTPVYLKSHHAQSVLLHYLVEQKNHSYGSTCHLLFLCLLYQYQFPRLFLAMREIIANAFVVVRISPRTVCKGTTKTPNGQTIRGLFMKYVAIDVWTCFDLRLVMRRPTSGHVVTSIWSSDDQISVMLLVITFFLKKRGVFQLFFVPLRPQI